MTPSRTASIAATLLAALAYAAPGQPAPDRAVAATPVPILMYHVIERAPSGAPYPELYVGELDFAAQMRWLARHGYRAVTLRDVWNHWHRARALPPKPIVISFDDGYRSVAESALPVMQKRSWPGVLNLTVRNLRVSGGLSQFDVRTLLSNGWELASHTVTHPDLRGLDDGAMRQEVAGSKALLRSRFGVPVDFFCYPAGKYDARVIRAVQRAGYLGATTTLDGLARPDEPYELRRVRVSGSDGVAGLAQKLRGLGS